MPDRRQRKTHARPHRQASATAFQNVILVLSGGNALGAYEAGAYEALDASGCWPRWLAGTSIGAVNAAIIAGNRAEERISKLQEFWDAAAGPDRLLAVPLPARGPGRRIYNLMNAADTLLFGRPNLFSVQLHTQLFNPRQCPSRTGCYDVRPLKNLLERLVDFGRLNSGEQRVTINATDVSTGEEVIFDSAREAIHPHHILASAAMPFDFPPIEIGGRWLSDGAMSANSAVGSVLKDPPQEDTICLVIDLFACAAAPPNSLDAALARRHDLPFANQTRRSVDALAQQYRLRDGIRRLAQLLPARVRDDEAIQSLASEGVDAAILLVYLSYYSPSDQLASKLYDYSRPSLLERWATGKRDMAYCMELAFESTAAPRRPGLRVLEQSRELGGPERNA